LMHACASMAVTVTNTQNGIVNPDLDQLGRQ